MAIKRSIVAASAAWACILPWGAQAADCAQIVRANVVQCALAASLEVTSERQGIAAQEGRLRAVSPWLPANPSLALSAGHRRTQSDSAVNWYATLSQEVEIAGQRAARRRATAAEKSAAEQATAATERKVAAQALRCYFEVLAARAALGTAVKLEEAFAHAAEAVQAGAGQGLVPGVDADVASLTVVRLSQLRIEAQHRYDAGLASLASLVGRDPTLPLVVEGELAPLSHASALSKEQAAARVAGRPELAELRVARQAHIHLGSALRRARIPNPTFSLFAQRDGFDERVLGGGLTLPVPLLSPAGGRFAGELAEQAARLRQAELAIESVERQTRLEAVVAWQAHAAAKAESALYTEQRVAQAEQTLANIASELASGRLTLASVLVAQQTSIEFLRTRVAAQLAVCLSSVELAWATGLPLLGASR